MTKLSTTLLLLLATCRMTIADCGSLSVEAGFPGRVLVQIHDTHAVGPSAAAVCVADASGVHALSIDVEGLTDIAWSGANEAIVLRCGRSDLKRPACTVASVTLDSQETTVFPSTERPEFEEADGRLTAWRLTKARPSRNGLLAVILRGRVLVFSLRGGALLAAFGHRVRDLVWVSGRAIAFAQVVATKENGSEATQLFIYDLASGITRQVSHLQPKKVVTWNPFGTAQLIYPNVSGLSWASERRAIAFMNSQAGDFYLLEEGGQISSHGELSRGCYFGPIVSPDATRVMYANGTTPSSCLIAGADQVRIRDLPSGRDELVLRVADEQFTVRRLDWIEGGGETGRPRGPHGD